MKRDLPAYCYRRGRSRHVYFCKHGNNIRVHAEPGTPEFAAEYALLLRGRPPAPKRTIKGLIQIYMGSNRWEELSPNTRRNYTRHFRFFEEKMPSVDPATLRTVHVYEMRDALKDTPTDATRKVGALATLLAYGVRIGWLDQNVAKGVSALKGKRPPRVPWPVEMIAAFRHAAPEDTRLIFDLLLGTGQRIGDVLKMTWADWDGAGISVKQSKTGAALYVPLTAQLAAVLRTTPKRGLTIVAQSNGNPVTYMQAHKWLMKIRKQIGAQAWDIHALRHSAASEIAGLPGMSAEHVMAITGHKTSGMVMLYARAAAQKARAKEAQKARDE
ncbi:tyrosine-type recombinase/integrase [Paracoccus sp. PAR01]|uniref:tyrosine-type recombinase/integrase n=1 Tax=Paracoccus sp. PAR01 TaxID=2769282 RepID=UPI00178046BE|nr:tyrosine-type recombinase/integrase [Paracoccus sp. PAR01]MBD9528414.1 tyrosine-type recombinase/integrase [Paracoccus sp. PAR01]